jgi:hypothetical protein
MVREVRPIEGSGEVGWHTVRMDGDDEEVTKRVVRRSAAAKPKKSGGDARAKTPKLPVYGTPPGTDPSLPPYGSRDSLKPVVPTKQDFDPRAEEKAADAAAAEAARKAKAAKAARAAKARAKKRKAAEEAKKQAARDAYAEKKERLAHIAEATRRARRQRGNSSGNIGYAKQRARRAASPARPVYSPERRPQAPAQKMGTGPKLLIAALVIAGAVVVPVIVTNNSSSSPTVSDGVDWAGYPGRYSGDDVRTLGDPSKEEVVANNVALLEEIRAAVEKEVAVSWVEHSGATESPIENTWGGPSMLVDWTSPRWYTAEEISNVELKQRLVDTVSEVLAGHGFEQPRLLNDPATSTWNAESIKQLYGAADTKNQAVWELRASSFDNSYTTFQLTITDFSKDKTGQFTKDAQRDAEFYNRPVSSLAMTLTSYSLLAADDEAEFRERAALFEDKKAPESVPSS